VHSYSTEALLLPWLVRFISHSTPRLRYLSMTELFEGECFVRIQTRVLSKRPLPKLTTEQH
jgi:hypothetical protein